MPLLSTASCFAQAMHRTSQLCCHRAEPHLLVGDAEGHSVCKTVTKSHTTSTLPLATISGLLVPVSPPLSTRSTSTAAPLHLHCRPAPPPLPPRSTSTAAPHHLHCRPALLPLPPRPNPTPPDAAVSYCQQDRYKPRGRQWPFRVAQRSASPPGCRACR